MLKARKGRTGSVIEKDGKLYARLQFAGADGRKRDICRKAENRSHAREIIRQLLREIDEQGEQTLDAARMTFSTLADYFKDHYLKPAAYSGTCKISGLRSLATPKGYLETLRSHFGKKLLRSIKHSDIRAFRDLRLQTPTSRDITRHEQELRDEPKAELKATRAIASVNREITVLRRMLGVATREGWIMRNPFSSGDSLVSVADEVRRERVLSHDEETRLLAACTRRRAHLKPLLIAALDTAMRRGEMLKLRWCDVDLAARLITVTALNSKTARGRTVAMTPRLYAELERLCNQEKLPVATDHVFGGVKDVKNAFHGACRAASVEGFRFHDLRHTAITRMVAAGVPTGETMKVSGHTQMATFLRYLNPTGDSVRRAADALASFNALASGVQEVRQATELVN